MTEDELKRILARNPGISVGDMRDYLACYGRKRTAKVLDDFVQASSEIPTPESERRTPDALDPVVQGEEASKARPIIRFIFYRTRLVDTDAVHAGAKDLLDGLVEAGLIAGDREDQIDFDARQEKVHYKKDERTEIELTLP